MSIVLFLSPALSVTLRHYAQVRGPGGEAAPGRVLRYVETYPEGTVDGGTTRGEADPLSARIVSDVLVVYNPGA